MSEGTYFSHIGERKLFRAVLDKDFPFPRGIIMLVFSWHHIADASWGVLIIMWQYILYIMKVVCMGPSKVAPPSPLFFGMLCQHIYDITGRAGGLFMKAAQSRTVWLVLQWVHWYNGTLVHLYMGTLVQWYIGTKVYWYNGTLVHW